jgi:ATP-dependent Clp protease protease subunit
MDIQEFLLGDITPEANLQLPDPNLVRYYKNFENRLIYLDGELGDDTLEYQREILQFNIDDKNIKPENRKPVRILINSPGGYLAPAVSLARTIKMSKTPIYTINISQALSAAFIILLSGHKRYVMPGAWCLFHNGSIGIEGTYDDTQASSKQYKKEISDVHDFIVENTEIPRTTLARHKNDWWISDKEALKYGVVDKIIDSIDEIIG